MSKTRSCGGIMNSPNFSETQLKIIHECCSFVWNLADKGVGTDKDFSPEINGEFLSIFADTTDTSGFKKYNKEFCTPEEEDEASQYKEAYDKMMRCIEEKLFDDGAFEGSNVRFPHDWILTEAECEEAYQ